MNKIKSIQVFGSNCPACKKLFIQTEEAVKQLELEVKAEYIDDIQKIIDMGMMTTPLLVINGEVVLHGQIPGVEKIKEIISGYKKEDNEECDNCCCGHGCCA